MIKYYYLPTPDKSFIRKSEDKNNKKKEFQSLITKYLNDPFFKKVREETTEGSVYNVFVSKVFCMLSIQSRYVIIFSKEDSSIPIPVGSLRRMSDIDWVSLQFRTFPVISVYEDTPLLNHNFPSSQALLNIKISKTNVTEESSIYKVESYPFVVLLMHTAKKTSLDYQDKGNILASIITWETVIQIE